MHWFCHCLSVKHFVQPLSVSRLRTREFNICNLVVKLSCFAALNTLRKAGGNSSYHKGIICAFAGFLALSIFNLLLIIVLGTQHNAGKSSHHKDQGSQRGQGQSGTTGYGSAPVTTGPAGANQGYGEATTMV